MEGLADICGAAQFHSTSCAFPCPLNVRSALAGQTVFGTKMLTLMLCPAAKLPLDGFKVIPLTPRLLTDQLRGACVLFRLLNVALHVQPWPGLYGQSVLALKPEGLTINVGGDAGVGFWVGVLPGPEVAPVTTSVAATLVFPPLEVICNVAVYCWFISLVVSTVTWIGCGMPPA